MDQTVGTATTDRKKYLLAVQGAISVNPVAELSSPSPTGTCPW